VRRHICVADSFTNCDSPVWDTDQSGDVISRTEITEDTGLVRSDRIQNMGDIIHDGIFIRFIKCLSAVSAWRNFVGVLCRVVRRETEGKVEVIAHALLTRSLLKAVYFLPLHSTTLSARSKEPSMSLERRVCEGVQTVRETPRQNLPTTILSEATQAAVRHGLLV
jgi:hypothetical protein